MFLSHHTLPYTLLLWTGLGACALVWVRFGSVYEFIFEVLISMTGKEVINSFVTSVGKLVKLAKDFIFMCKFWEPAVQHLQNSEFLVCLFLFNIFEESFEVDWFHLRSIHAIFCCEFFPDIGWIELSFHLKFIFDVTGMFCILSEICGLL